jgi:hypothetical protein
MKLQAFGETAIQALKAACPEAIIDGLFRVDIMQRQCGDLVVNEFESMEAVAYSRGSSNKEMMIRNFLEEYWLNLFKSMLIDKLIT